jgi:hypothetical protein
VVPRSIPTIIAQKKHRHAPECNIHRRKVETSLLTAAVRLAEPSIAPIANTRIMRHPLSRFAVLLFCASLWKAPARGNPQDERSSALVAALTAAFEPPAWRQVSCSPPRKIDQNPGQIYNAGLAPVWVVEVESKNGGRGYLMWEDVPGFPLVDFAWDAPESVCLPRPGKGALVPQVPNQQQFPVPGLTSPSVASGCVPTAASNLVGYWALRGQPQWAGKNDAPGQAPNLRMITNRLRKRLRMQEIPDKDGFTDNGMPLSGAFPTELKEGLLQDATDHGVLLETSLQKFSPSTMRQETAAGRPVLLSCLVRLPQKPWLSWGHEVTGSGWVEIEGRFFAGVRDNFLPSKSGETTRWISEVQIQTLLRAEPRNGSIRTE